MPVTAKLSKAFYDKVGEQVTNELVDWFNQVDATYRSDLRQLNEQNFGRFDAKLEQRIEVLRAQLDAKIDELRAHFDAKLDSRIEAAKSELIKWMFVFWTGAVLAGRLLR